MAARKNNAWWLLPCSALLMLNAYANEAIAIKLENHLAACITINKPAISTTNGMLFAKISYVQKDSVGACGCTSLMSNYISYGGKKERHAFLMSGNLVFGKAGTVNLPLTMSQLLVVEKTIKLEISCAASE